MAVDMIDDQFAQHCGVCDQQSLRSACAYAQSDQSLCLSLEYSMTVKLLAEHHLEFLSLKGGCKGSSESTLVKVPHCWKSHVLIHFKLILIWRCLFLYNDLISQMCREAYVIKRFVTIFLLISDIIIVKINVDPDQLKFCENL